MPNHTIYSTAAAFGNAMHTKYSCSVERDDPHEHDDGDLGLLLRAPSGPTACSAPKRMAYAILDRLNSTWQH
jgi:hypothetical protein